MGEEAARARRPMDAPEHSPERVVQGSADLEPAEEPNCDLRVLASTEQHTPNLISHHGRRAFHPGRNTSVKASGCASADTISGSNQPCYGPALITNGRQQQSEALLGVV